VENLVGYVRRNFLVPLPAVYTAHYRQLQGRREGSAGAREYIRILLLLKDHTLQKVTAAVEQAAALGLYGYSVCQKFFPILEIPKSPLTPL
jgi:hypothetical protein